MLEEEKVGDMLRILCKDIMGGKKGEEWGRKGVCKLLRVNGEENKIYKVEGNFL